MQQPPRLCMAPCPRWLALARVLQVLVLVLVPVLVLVLVPVPVPVLVLVLVPVPVLVAVVVWIVMVAAPDCARTTRIRAPPPWRAGSRTRWRSCSCKWRARRWSRTLCVAPLAAWRVVGGAC